MSKQSPRRSAAAASRARNFSIVAVAEGAMSREDAAAFAAAAEAQEGRARPRREQAAAQAGARPCSDAQHAGNTLRLAKQLEELTGLEVARHDPRLRAARRHAVGRRPPAGHAAGHGLRRPHPAKASSA